MANSAVVGILRALLTADTAEFDTAMKRAGESAKKLSKDFTKTGQQLTQLGSSLTRTVTLPIVGLGVAAGKAAIDFESSFAGVRKTVTATEPEFQKLALGFRNLAKEIPINVNELNRIGEAAGQLGIDKQNIIAFTDVVAKLGVTTNLSSDQAATSLARLANITQMPQTEFDRLGATVVDLGNNFATTESEIVDFALRIAGAGKQVGLTEPQILGIGAALSSVGINAEAGGTAISRVMVDISKAVEMGGTKLDRFAEVAGLSASEFAERFKTDAAGAIVSFVEGLGRIQNEGGNTFQVLDELGQGNVRVRDALLRSAGAGDLLRESLRRGTEAWAANNALTEEAQKRFETAQSKLTLLWNRLRDVAITFGDSLLPVLTQFVGLLEDIVPVLDTFVKGFAALPKFVQEVFIGIGGLAAAAGPLAYLAGQLYTTAGRILLIGTNADKAAPALKRFWASLTGPVAIGLAGLTAIDYLLEKIRDKLNLSAQDFAKIFGNAFPGFGATTNLRALIDNIKDAGLSSDVAEQLESIAKGFEQAAAGAILTGKAYKDLGSTERANQLLSEQTRKKVDQETASHDRMTESLENEKQQRDFVRDAVLDLNRAVSVATTEMFVSTARVTGAVEIQVDKVDQLQDAYADLNSHVSRTADVLKQVDAVPPLKPPPVNQWDVFHSTLAKVADSFSRLAQISDGFLSGLLRGFGTVVSSVDAFITSLRAATSSAGTFLSRLTGVAGIATLVAQGIGAIIQGLENLTISQDVVDLQAQIRRYGVEPIESTILNHSRYLELLQQQLADIERRLFAVHNEAQVIDLGQTDTGQQWRELIALAQQYGVEVDQLGDRFQQQRIIGIGDELARDIQRMIELGGDQSTILRGVQDELQDVVTQAMTAGVALPDSLRPFLQQLVDMGQLVDENGNRIEDLGRLSFTSDLPKAVTQLSDSIEIMSDALNKLVDRLSYTVKTVNGVTLALPAKTAPIPSFAGRTAESVVSPGLVMTHPGDIVGTPQRLMNMARQSYGSFFGSAASMPAAYRSAIPARFSVKISNRTLADVLVDVLPGVVEEYVGV